MLKLETEAKARIKALQNAACHGIADIEAGRHHTFDSPGELDRHLATLRDGVLSRKGRQSGGCAQCGHV